METTKNRILQASSELFRRQGMTGTGITQILDVAGAPSGSLYHHFPGGKDELAAATIELAGAEYGRLVLELLASHEDPVDAIRAAFRHAGETLIATDFADACPIETIALEVASTNETLRIATALVFGAWLDGLAQWLTAHGIGDDDAIGLSLTILSALEGAFILARSMRRVEPLDACGAAMAQLIAAEA